MTVDKILLDVKAISNRAFVRDIDDHYAGYFDELGITVNLVDQTTEMEWRKLAEDLLAYLN